MVNIYNTIGYVGLLCMLIIPLPEFIKAFRNNWVDLSYDFLILQLFGNLIMGIYNYIKSAYIGIYASIIAVCSIIFGIILKYTFEKKKQQKETFSNVVTNFSSTDSDLYVDLKKSNFQKNNIITSTYITIIIQFIILFSTSITRLVEFSLILFLNWLVILELVSFDNSVLQFKIKNKIKIMFNNRYCIFIIFLIYLFIYLVNDNIGLSDFMLMKAGSILLKFLII